jgi:hypothetical protein
MLIEHEKHGRMHVQSITEAQAQAGWREVVPVKPEPIEQDDDKPKRGRRKQ